MSDTSGPDDALAGMDLGRLVADTRPTAPFEAEHDGVVLTWMLVDRCVLAEAQNRKTERLVPEEDPALDVHAPVVGERRPVRSQERLDLHRP